MAERAVDVDVSKQGITIDGELLKAADITIENLTRILGPAREQAVEDSERLVGTARIVVKDRVWHFWDDAGISAIVDGGKPIAELRFRTAADPAWKSERSARGAGEFRLRGVFGGELTVAGSPLLDAVLATSPNRGRSFEVKIGPFTATLLPTTDAAGPRAFIPHPSGQGGVLRPAEGFAAVERRLRSTTQPFCEVWLEIKRPRRVSKAVREHWRVPATDEPTVAFVSFPWKLAVMEQLMYLSDVLRPRFSLGEFNESLTGKAYLEDPYGADDIVMPAVEWLRDYPITLSQAAEVTTVMLDGGLRIYREVYPIWGGEDDTFAIDELDPDEIAPFVNLRRVEGLTDSLSDQACQVLRDHGVAIEAGIRPRDLD